MFAELRLGTSLSLRSSSSLGLGRNTLATLLLATHGASGEAELEAVAGVDLVGDLGQIRTVLFEGGEPATRHVLALASCRPYLREVAFVDVVLCDGDGVVKVPVKRRENGRQ